MSLSFIHQYPYFVFTNKQISLINVKAKLYRFPFAMKKNIPDENNFRNCPEVVVVKWQICGLEIEDQHLRRSDKKSCWTKESTFEKRPKEKYSRQRVVVVTSELSTWQPIALDQKRSCLGWMALL